MSRKCGTVNLYKRQETVDGYEKVFATNNLGHFLLTNLLLDTIKKSDSGRIVNVASGLQAAIDFDDLMSEKKYSPFKVYSRSKMANIMFTYELAERLKDDGIIVNCVHPGLVRTNLASDAHIVFKVMRTIAKLFSKSPKKGAETIIYLATSPEVENITGKYFVNKKEKRSKRESYIKSDIKKLWKISSELTNVT